MSVTYHINALGEVGRCKARQGGCPFGGDSDHYPSKEAARRAYEEKMKSLSIPDRAALKQDLKIHHLMEGIVGRYDQFKEKLCPELDQLLTKQHRAPGNYPAGTREELEELAKRRDSVAEFFHHRRWEALKILTNERTLMGNKKNLSTQRVSNAVGAPGLLGSKEILAKSFEQLLGEKRIEVEKRLENLKTIKLRWEKNEAQKLRLQLKDISALELLVADRNDFARRLREWHIELEDHIGILEMVRLHVEQINRKQDNSEFTRMDEGGDALINGF